MHGHAKNCDATFIFENDYESTCRNEFWGKLTTPKVVVKERSARLLRGEQETKPK